MNQERRNNQRERPKRGVDLEGRVPEDPEDGKGLIAAWHTNHRVTVYLIENLPPELWSQSVPGSPRRTVRMLAAHIHNARCMWIKMLGARHRIPVPRTVDGRRVRPPELLRGLSRSLSLIHISEPTRH